MRVLASQLKASLRATVAAALRIGKQNCGRDAAAKRVAATKDQNVESKSGADLSPPEPAYAAQLQREADQVRDAAKWLLATLGAVAAILVAGLQFKAIGSVPGGWRTAGAIGGAAIVIAGVAMLIWFLLAVMLPSTVTIADVADGRAPQLRKYLGQNRDALQGYADPLRLYQVYLEAIERANSATLDYYETLRASGTEDSDEAKSAQFRAQLENARLAFIDAKVGSVTKLLAVEQLRSRFGLWPRLAVFLAAVAIGAGIGFFAWGTNAPKAKSASSNSVDLAG